MTQRHVLGDEVYTPLKDDGDKGENQRELGGHPAKDTLNPIGRKSSAITLPYVILTRQCVQLRLALSAGVSPARARVRSPVA